MNKDVIYIDVEDDITAIIGRIKASSEKIVALVPPKRVGILQSAVNLRLLDRMATNSHKKLVIISNNPALMGLTAAAGIPVAKNLQSKPEIAEIAALSIDDGEDIIDGANLPIGELEKTADLVTVKDGSVDDAIETIDIDDTKVATAAVGAAAVSRAKSSAKKSSIKIPDFNRFRKRLFLGITGGVLLIVFLVWANFFAPGATIVITAKTNQAPISTTVTLSGATPTDVKKGTIQSITQTLKKDLSVKFNATGSQDVGAKATGTITIRNCDYPGGFTLSSGTQFTSPSGQVFVSTALVVVPGYTSPSSSTCSLSGASAGKKDVAVQATTSGEANNIAATSYTIDPAKIPTGSKVDAPGTIMAGGTSKIATVVSADDIQKATDALNSLSTDDMKKAVTAQFKNGEIIIAESFNADHAAPVSTPALGAESDAQATLTSTVTFTLIGIPKADVELYLKDALGKQITNEANQRIYSTGIDSAVLAGYSKTGDTATVNISAKGQIGPNINTDTVKQNAKGKKGGEVQAQLTSIPGVDSVQVNFSYFWVTTVPSDITKVDVQFKLTNG